MIHIYITQICTLWINTFCINRDASFFACSIQAKMTRRYAMLCFDTTPLLVQPKRTLILLYMSPKFLYIKNVILTSFIFIKTEQQGKTVSVTFNITMLLQKKIYATDLLCARIDIICNKVKTFVFTLCLHLRSPNIYITYFMVCSF